MSKANDNVRQDLWDRLLIEGWLADGAMHIAAKYYYLGCGDYFKWNEQSSGIDVCEYMKPLKRGIRGGWELRWPVRAFFDLALPTTNKWLWAGARGERVMKILENEMRLTMEGTRAKHGRHKKNQASKRDVKLAEQQISRSLSDPHAGHRRRDWHKIK